MGRLGVAVIDGVGCDSSLIDDLVSGRLRFLRREVSLVPDTGGLDRHAVVLDRWGHLVLLLREADVLVDRG